MRKRITLIERFKEKVSDKDSNGCMNWTGCRNGNRYGTIMTGSRHNGTRKQYSSHRLSYELFIGKIPDGLCVLHKCDNVLCVNPDHLFLGTQSDNMNDMIKKGRDFHVISIGSNHGNSKLNEQEVKEIKISLKNGSTPKELSKIYNVNVVNIRLIGKGKAWKHVII